jgi:hypothetical protein
MRSSRTRWLFLAAIVALLLASLRATPLHGHVSVMHAALEIARTLSAFAVAAFFVGLARASMQRTIPVVMIGAMHGMYATVVASIRLGYGATTWVEALVGGLLAMLGAMVGAWLAAVLARLPRTR